MSIRDVAFLFICHSSEINKNLSVVCQFSLVMSFFQRTILSDYHKNQKLVDY